MVAGACALFTTASDAQITSELRARAKAGDAVAQNELGGELLALGNSDKEAREWFRKAMLAGSPDGKNNYASLLYHGAGGPADPTTARRLVEEAAAAGSPAAKMTLAERYLAGADGYPRDAPRAFALRNEAANGDSAPLARCYAEWQVGMMWLSGQGTVKDSRQAFGWVKRSADHGCANGKLSQAVMLATGDGVAEDDVAARNLYSDVGHSGDVNFAHGLRSLGAMTIVGEGGSVDLARGCAYVMIAMSAGDKPAKQVWATYEDRLLGVRKECIKISNEWSDKNLKSRSRG